MDHQEVQLKFTAPRWVGVYTFTVCLRSGEFCSGISLKYLSETLFFLDSYVGMDQQLDLKLDVKEAAAIPTEHPQWDISESESEGHQEQVGNESEFTTDSSDAEDN